MKKILLGIVAVMMGVSVASFLAAPVMAAGKSCVETSEIMATDKCEKKDGDLVKKSGGDTPCVCDNGKGDSVISVLNLVAEILTIGVGILGVLGITIVGIQYLTAGGNEAQVMKAKRRMLDIVIGIVAYVLLYALLSWLVKGFKPFG